MPRIEIDQVETEPARFKVQLRYTDAARERVEHVVFLDLPKLMDCLTLIGRKMVGQQIASKREIGPKWMLFAASDDETIRFREAASKPQ